MPNFITGNDVKTQIIRYNDNLGGATDDQIISWIDFLQQDTYPKLYNVNPNDYAKNYFVKTVSSAYAYRAPIDFKCLIPQGTGVYETKSGNSYLSVNFKSKTAVFTVGDTVTGHTSGMTGTVYAVTDYGTTGTIALTAFSNTGGIQFVDNELITSSGGGSANIDGLQYTFDFWDRKLPETWYGATDTGFWLDSTNINFTSGSGGSIIGTYNFRYIPVLPTYTDTTFQASTIFTTEYLEFVQKSVDVFWQQWRKGLYGIEEYSSAQRALAGLNFLLKNVKKTPAIIELRDARGVHTGTSARRQRYFI